MTNLLGLHDKESIEIAPNDTWVLDTIAISENPKPEFYNPKYQWIGRLNWGYNGAGSIPLPEKDILFQTGAAMYAAKSTGCHRWIVGNENNLKVERSEGVPVSPSRYAECFVKVRDAIRSMPGHNSDEVLIAASGPWNTETKYAGNPEGDWIQYFVDQINACQGKFDGFSIHSYTHGYAQSLVWSEAKMNPPFQNRHYEFRTYRDYCNAIPEEYAHLPIYLTEANGNGSWKAVGLMDAMAQEINAWNLNSNKRKIKSLIFYCYINRGDGYQIRGKEDVVKEYKDAVALGIQSPALVEPTKKQGPIFMPKISVPEKVIGSGITFAGILNVRKEASAGETEIVGQLPTGTQINIYEQKTVGDELWYRIGENQWVIAEWVKRNYLTKDNRSRCLQFILKWEGGWADDPNDVGGATMKGITIGTYTTWRLEKGQPLPTKEDLRNISNAEVEQIYHDRYWIPSKAYQMPWPMCLAVVDLAVNGGVARAEQALKECGLDFWDYMVWRRNWYRGLSQFNMYGTGWINRCKDLIMVAYE